MKRARVLCVSSLLAGAVFAGAPLHAQADDWLAWHGCWQAEGAPAGEYLCIVPDGVAGMRMLTVGGGALVAESRVVTDGRPRRVQTEGCEGSEVAFWSADYHRVFLSSELSCEAGVKRQASGIFTITGEASWMSVQAVTIDGRTATRTVRYAAVDDAVAPSSIRSALRSSGLERAAARNVALSPVDADDVNEAVGRIDAAAVQEWLIASGQPFQLAGELAPAAADAVTRSALDHSGSFTQQPTREVTHVVERPVEIVHVVERPVYVTHRHVYEYRYRTCWDPFFSGLVIGLGHGAGIGLGRAHCSRRYFTYYSPWGYDLFGWRFVHVRPIIVAGRPIIHYRDPYRPPRVIRTSRRDDERRTPDTRTPTRPRRDYAVRTGIPRDASPATRTALLRDRAPATGGRTAGTIGSGEATRSAPTRYAQPRTPSRGSPPRALPPAGVSQPIRVAEPRRNTPPSRAPLLERDRTQSIEPPRPRSAEPRAAIRSYTPTPPRARPVTTSREAQPRPVLPARSPTSAGVTSAPRTPRQPAAATSSNAPPSRGTTPARIAKPRGGDERR